MRYSELKVIVTEAHRYGLKKIPGENMWLKQYMFYEITANFYITNIELVYNIMPLADMLNMKYKDFWEKYQEKYGKRTWSTKTLNLKLEN